MRSLPFASLLCFLCVLGAACGEIIPLETDATPTCEPACGEHATCTGTTCACDTGWEGSGQTCTDVNECATNNGGCDPNATCFNNDGGRNCGCNTGFIGDGMTCRQVWTPRGSASIRLTNIIANQTNDAMAAVIGNRIYFAPDIGADGDTSNHFLRYFDFQTMQFSGALAIPPAGTSDFCACGYTEVFVSDGTDLYMFGNDGYRYVVASNQWVAITTYSGTFQRGESAGAYERNNNTIYMIGGRGPLDTAQRYSPPPANNFVAEPGTLPFPVDSARAWAPPGNNLVYVAGGFWNDNSRQHFVRHATGTGVWTSLPDAPISLGGITGMGDFQGKIWVTTSSQMAFYDIAGNTWSPPRSLPGGFVLAVSAGARTFALVQGANTLEVQELTAIE